MAVCVKVVNSLGTEYLALDTANTDPMNCPGWVIPTGDEYRSFWIAQPVEITSEQVLYVFSWGMGAVLTMFFLGYVVSVAVRTVRKA